MSNRYAPNQHRQDSATKNFPRTQKQFVPRSQNATSSDANPCPTLSNSLRKSSSQPSGGSSSSGGGAGASTTRVRLGESGEWVPSRGQNGSFVNYLPQDEAVAAGLGASEGGLDPAESQRVVDLLNRELSRLLKLNPREFWRGVAGDSSLHEFLDSFLKFRSRWYDFPHHGAKGIVAGVIVGEVELSHRVFMVLYRISSNRDPGARAADALSAQDHGVLLQEKKLLDLPKLLDICAIYGRENEDLTRLLVFNALKAQPWIHYNLKDVASHFMGIVQTMQDRCTSSLELLSVPGAHEDSGINKLHSDFLEVMDFINDAISSMDAYINAYARAAAFFACPVETSNGNEDLLSTLVKLHDSLLPSLRKGFRIIYSSGDVISHGDGIKSSAMSLKLLSMRIVKFGWNLLDACYLREEVFEESFDIPATTKIFPAKVEDPVIRADIIVQTFREISSLSVQVQENQNHETFLQKIQRSHNIISRFQSLQSKGWIVMDDEQMQYLSNVMGSTLHAPSKAPPYVPTSVAGEDKAQMDEDAAVLESKISQIKDLFPDYGKGFLSACLEVYNQNPEEVIQRILEGTLHQDLQSLDTSLDTVPLSESSPAISKMDKGKGKLPEFGSVAPGMNKTDKGKGKLSESVSPALSVNPLPVFPEQLTEGSSSSSGRYVRKNKSDVPHSDTLDTRDRRDTERISNLASQYEYEDEYDDSFDDLGLGAVESGFEDNERLNDGAETVGSSQSPAASTKWGSRKKPQYYVKDGKNYSYKVEGSVAVANANEASLVTQAQSELIYGLGRGGNLPLGAVKKLEESRPVENNLEQDGPEIDGRGIGRNHGGRGRRGGGRGRDQPSHEGQDSQVDASEGEGRGSPANNRGRGRRGGGRNHYRKDRAMNKHFASLGGR